jgi:excisionase family DNA binding protein
VFPVSTCVSASVRAVPDLPRYLTAVEAAEYLRISTRHLRRATASGHIPVSRLGRKLLYDRAELDEYVRRSRVQPGEDFDDVPDDDTD